MLSFSIRLLQQDRFPSQFLTGIKIILAWFVRRVLTIEIVVLEGESTNEKWKIFLGYQGKLIMVLTSAVRLGWLLQKKIFWNSIKQVSLVSSADVNTIIFWPFWSSCMHKCILLLEFTTISMVLTQTICTKRLEPDEWLIEAWLKSPPPSCTTSSGARSSLQVLQSE